jgi:hypothetical protein
MRLVPLAVLALAAACAPGDRASEAEAAPAAAIRPDAGAASERSVLSIERGGSTILTERVTRTADRLESELSAGPSEGRMTYAATLNPDASVSRLEGQIFEAGAARSAPAGRISVVFQGDSALLELTEADGTQRARIGVPRGTIPIPVSEAVATVEQILRRARALGGTHATVPVLTIEKGVHTGTAQVTFAGDSARVVVRGEGSSTEMMVATDSAGRLLGGRVPASGLVIRRTP